MKTREDVRRLYCIVQNYASALEDQEFIDSWRIVKYSEEYEKAVFELAELLKEIDSGYEETDTR